MQCEGCLDMALLDGLEAEIRAMSGDGVIVLHTMGSHGPAYYQRYPEAFRRFTPTCDTSQIQDCSREALRNTYRNTILYIDHMLAATMAVLEGMEDTDSALWYFSDHGESLGENGLYLHAAPYAIAPAEQTHVPMVFWAQPGWYGASGISRECLAARAGEAYAHDHVFHSLLGLYGVRTDAYQAALDMFAPCRAE